MSAAWMHPDLELVPPLPADLAFGDDPPPLTDADLEAWDYAVAEAQDDEPHSEALLAVQALIDGTEENHRPAWVYVPEPVRRFRIEDDAAAEWAMRKVAEIDGELAKLKALHDGWLERITTWFDRGARRLTGRRMMLVAHLEDYARRERAAGNRKTVALPSGKVATRSTAMAAAVADEAAVIAWAEANLEGDDLEAVVKVVRSVRVSDLRERTTLAQWVGSVQFVAHLSCGHTEESWVTIDPLDPAKCSIEYRESLAPWTPGEQVPCSSCEGNQATIPRFAQQIATFPEFVTVVLDADGKLVPGTTVTPEKVSTTVTPG